MAESEKENRVTPRWIIGLIISAILLLCINLIIDAYMEKVVTTNPDPNADLVILGFVPLYLIPITVMFIFLLMSLSQKKKNIPQFDKKYLWPLILIIAGFFFASYLLGYLTPTTNEKSVEACTRYANAVRYEFCVKHVCNSGFDSDNCLFDAAVRYSYPELCEHIESLRQECYCLFETSKLMEERKMLLIDHPINKFISSGGDCNIISNLEESTTACSAIRDKDKSLCDQLDDSPRSSTEQSLFGIFR